MIASPQLATLTLLLLSACAGGAEPFTWTMGQLAPGSRISVEHPDGTGWKLEIGRSDITLEYNGRRVDLIGFGRDSVAFERVKSDEPRLVLRSSGLPSIEWTGPELRIAQRVYDLTKGDGAVRIDAASFRR